MKVLRSILAIQIIGGLLSVIGISSSQMPPKTPEHRLKPDQAQTLLDLHETRLIRQRASRASSERSVIASADTITPSPTTTPEPTTTHPRPAPSTKLKSPRPTTTVPSTEQPTTETIHDNTSENSTEGNYNTCFAAAASVKTAKVAPNVARWINLVEKYFPAEIYKTCRVMACESGGNPGAVGPRQPNGSYPQGLMQILNGPFDPEANMALAARMRASRGWQPWACK
jgi:hypothetical protein